MPNSRSSLGVRLHGRVFFSRSVFFWCGCAGVCRLNRKERHFFLSFFWRGGKGANKRLLFQFLFFGKGSTNRNRMPFFPATGQLRSRTMQRELRDSPGVYVVDLQCSGSQPFLDGKDPDPRVCNARGILVGEGARTLVKLNPATLPASCFTAKPCLGIR